MKPKLIVGGVPEHFNIPLYYGIENGKFDTNEINYTWTSYPGGTGAMLKDLQEGRLDIATLLTEGAVYGILEDCPAKIIKFYVDSPLNWGIHVKAGSGITMDDLQGKKYAISRFKSGSHLMPLVNAEKYGLTIQDEDFVIVKNLDGAREALKNGDADIFFWEKFITQPYVDNGEFERIGKCPTPWPSFVLVVRNEILEKYPYTLLQQFIQVLHSMTRSLIQSGHLVEMVANEFNLSHFDAVKWYATVEWNKDPGMDTQILSGVIKRLEKLGLVPDNKMDKTIQHLVDYRSIESMVQHERLIS